MLPTVIQPPKGNDMGDKDVTAGSDKDRIRDSSAFGDCTNKELMCCQKS
jgi:hypothetical protein